MTMANLASEALKCEGCDRYRHLTPFGEHDTMLCTGEAPGDKGCWDSAWFHSKRSNKGLECGIDTCRICYEED